MTTSPAGYLKKRGTVVCDAGDILDLRIDDVDPHIQGGGGHQDLGWKSFLANNILPDVAAFGLGIEISGEDIEFLD